MPKFEHVEAGVYKIIEDKIPFLDDLPNYVWITKDEVEDLQRFIEETERKLYRRKI